MRAMSFVRGWLYGIGVFIAVTASLTVAMTIAITGPPTTTEIEKLGAILAEVARDIGATADGVSADACEQIPPETTGSLCPGAATNADPAPVDRAEPEQAIIIEAPRRVAEETEFAAESDASADATVLLGDVADDVRRQSPGADAARVEARPVERSSARASAGRATERGRLVRQRARPRVRPSPPPPIATTRVEGAPPLPDTWLDALEDVLDASAPEVVAEEAVMDDGPTQHEAAPVEEEWPRWKEEAVEEDPYEEEPVYDEGGQYEEEEAYERERYYADREARRRYREERARAYYEWRRRYRW